jgi:hypothetical protein
MTEGVDYSWARPDPVKLYAVGKRFACRYLSNSTRIINGVTKNLSKAEADALHAAGVATVSNWEWTATDATKGYAAGRSYATEAAAQHRDCGGPPDRPIYFSVDFDLGAASTATKDAVRQYFAGIRSVLGHQRTGIYGGRYAVKLAHDEFWCDWFWQAYAWSNISTLGWLPYTHLQQYNNGETVAGTPGIDLDRAMQADYGQWGIQQQPEEPFMAALTDAQQAELYSWAKNVYAGMFKGGPSCGNGVPDAHRASADDSDLGNALFSKLNYVQKLLEGLATAPGVGLSATDLANIREAVRVELDATHLTG